MIVATYADLKPGARIVLASGRIVHVIATVPLGRETLVRLRAYDGKTRDLTVDPGEYVLYATPDAFDAATDLLRRHGFPNLEFLRSI